MKHHVVSDQGELQNFISINSMNVTVGGNKKNNFFMAKDSLKHDGVDK